MKNLRLKITVCALAAMLAVSSAACTLGSANSSSSESETDSALSESEVSVEVEEDTDSEEPDTDIGEHKDYAEEECEGYYSNGVLIVNQDGHVRAMDTFLGTNADFYVSELNTLKDTIDTDINVYSLVAPTACEYYCPSNYRDDITSQADVISDIGNKLAGVINVDPCETLNNHNAEAIYSRTDHHWTALGAYYACKVFAKAAGVDYPDISEYEKGEYSDYIGSMTAFTGSDGSAALEADPETFTYYRPMNQYTAYYYNYYFDFVSIDDIIVENENTMYLTFIKGDSYSVKIKTDVDNDRNLLVIKDSFGNAAIPFLTNSFEEIYVVDMRYLEVNLYDVIEKFGITDIVYIMNTFSAVGNNAYNLETLRTQQTIVDLDDDTTDYEVESEAEQSRAAVVSSETRSYDGNGYTYGVGLNNVVSYEEPSKDESPEDYYSDYTDNGDADDTYNGEEDYYDYDGYDYGGYDNSYDYNGYDEYGY